MHHFVLYMLIIFILLKTRLWLKFYLLINATTEITETFTALGLPELEKKKRRLIINRLNL